MSGYLNIANNRWLVVIVQPTGKKGHDFNLSTECGELEGLVHALNTESEKQEVVACLKVSTSSLKNPNLPEWLIEQCENIVKDSDLDGIAWSIDLKAGQVRQLDNHIPNCLQLDHTELILRIFQARAHTHEGKLQVELAKLRHERSRLVRIWTHLERQRGGIGLRGGMGEKQIEIDRRLLDDKVKKLEDKLEKTTRQRNRQRERRQAVPLPAIALVGYTNVGKSTLFNRLTGAQVEVANKLFATLDPTVRVLRLEHGHEVLLADTVGFIRRLPHTLVEAFKATLEEVNQANLILHVEDAASFIADPKREEIVTKTLEQIEADNIPRRFVLNKVDSVSQESRSLFPDDAILVSAITGEGLKELSHVISDFCQKGWTNTRLKVTSETYQKLVDELGVQAVVIEESEHDLMWVRCSGPSEILKRLMS